MTDFADLIDLPRDELLAQLGTDVFEATPRDAVTRGKEMYATIRVALRDVICSNPSIHELAIESEKGPEIVAALVDLISSQVHGVPAATLAVLMFKDGIPKLCADQWATDQVI
jgi:hypothetical protein